MKFFYAFLLSFLLCQVALAQAFSKAASTTNTAIGFYPDQNYPADPVSYWKMRDQAIQGAKRGEWSVVLPLLEKITLQYSDDGDSWFLLGHAYLQTKQYQQAIPAFKQALQLGTILTGVKSASAPSNDIMVKIAECYAALKDSANAMLWLNNALLARWDDRKSLINNAAFANLSGLTEFHKITGEFTQPNLTSAERWQADLDFLLSEIERLHVNPYHHISKDQLQQHVNLIKKDIPQLSDPQVVFSFMQLLGSLGNGHNFILPTGAKTASLVRLPLQFYWFHDGVYVVQATEQYQHLVGQQLLKVAETPVDQVLAKLASVNARDNEMQQLWLGPYYLSLPDVLAGAGVIENVRDVPLTFATATGQHSTLNLSGEPFSFTGFPTLPELKYADNPLYLKNKGRNYWYKTDKENNYLYLQFNAVAQEKSQSLEAFGVEVRQQLAKRGVDNLIVDLRHNSGGNGSILPPLTRALIHFKEQRAESKLFVIVGRNTFSAAHLLLADLNRLTDAIIVGEPSGSRPNHLGEAGWFKLPYSGVVGIISSQFHQASKAEDHRIWVAPQLPVTLDSKQYFSGKDPAMDAIVKLIKS